MRVLNFSDGFTTPTGPSQGVLQASSLRVFASDADFVTDKGAAVAQGDLYSRSTDDVIRYYNGTSWVSLAEGDLAAHIADTSAAHAASAIAFTPVGTIAGSDLQTAVAEVATDAATALAAHEADTTSVHGIADTADLLTTTNAKAVTNKDIDGGTASDSNRFTVPKASKATLDALARKQATVVYASDTDKLYYDNGYLLKAVGSGSGSGVNLITDGDSEASNIFSQYNDTAAGSTTRPVDGTGGTASNLSSSVSATSPLDGTQSFILSKSGSASTQGMGWSVDTTTIGTAYKAKVLQVEFDYIVSSGTFVTGSSSTESDVIIYLYDVTNSQLIEPSSIKLLSNSTTISDKFVANFQTSATGSQYRLILHCQSSSTANYSLKLDNISIKPCNYVYGTPITDWQSYSLTIGGSTTAPTLGTTTTNAARWRRVGDSMQISYSLVQTGAGTAGSGYYKFPLPAGYTADSNKILTTNNNVVNVGASAAYNGGNVVLGVAQLIDASTIVMTTTSDVSAPNQIGSAFYQLSGTTIQYGFTAQVPITGWSSSVQMSDGYDGRSIVFKGTQSSESVTANVTNITFASSKDSVAGWSTNIYMAGKFGDYLVSVSGVCSATGAFAVYRGSSVAGYTASCYTNGAASGGSVLVENVTAGETISVRFTNNATVSAGQVSIIMWQAPTTMSTQAVNACRYNVASGFSSSASEAVVNFATRKYDYMAAVTTGASWAFKAESEGVYECKGKLTRSAAAEDADAWVSIYYNNVLVDQTYVYRQFTSPETQLNQLPWDTEEYLLAGQTIQIKLRDANSGTWGNNSYENWVAIKKIK